MKLIQHFFSILFFVSLTLPAFAQPGEIVYVQENNHLSGFYNVQLDGEMEVVVIGADGGDGSASRGGSGATIIARVQVNQGDVFRFVTGQRSASAPSGSAGGAGSTGVYLNGTLVSVAGGGAGGDNSANSAGLGGGVSTPGLSGTGTGPGAGGVPGGGGQDTQNTGNGGAGGGGWSFDGTSANLADGGKKADQTPLNGLQIAQGGGAGNGNNTAGADGFSGGGGASGNAYSGGGGGFSGGGAAGANGAAGGGGSFILGGAISSRTVAGRQGYSQNQPGSIYLIFYDTSTDTDEDGIANYVDLDDDNDGITDINESSCAIYSFTWENLGLVNNQTLSEYELFDNGVSLMSVTHQLYQDAYTDLAPIANEDFSYYNSGQTGAQNGNLLIGFDNNAIDFSDSIVSIFTFDEAVENLSFSVLDIDQNDGHDDAVEIFYQENNSGVWVNIRQNPSLYNFGGAVIQDNEFFMNGFEGIADVQNNSTNGNLNVDFGAIEVSKFKVKFFMTDDSDHGVQAIAISDIFYRKCVALDSDNDGIGDDLEVDSDDDSCPDAIEAGFEYTDIHLQGADFWELLGAIDGDGIPQLASGGVANNSFVTNGTQQGPNCEIFFSLAIELVDFKVKKQDKNALLTWQTLSENNNDRFDVYWRTDQQDWIKIGEVDGAGNSTHPLSYSFTHYSPSVGNNYYQLRDVDYNGVSTKSVVRNLYFIYEDNGLTIYPNPNKNKFTVIHYKDIDLLNVEVFDLQGKKTKIKSTYLHDKIEVNHSLKPGFYTLVVSYTNQTKEYKEFVVK